MAFAFADAVFTAAGIVFLLREYHDAMCIDRKLHAAAT